MLLLAPLPIFKIRALAAQARCAFSKIVRQTKLSRSIGNAVILRLDGSRRYITLHCCLCFDLNGTISMLKDYLKKGGKTFLQSSFIVPSIHSLILSYDAFPSTRECSNMKMHEMKHPLEAIEV